MTTLCSEQELERILDLFVSLQPMKELKRQGAIYYGERLAEADTIAGHSFTVASLAWLLARALAKKGHRINVQRTLEIALCHDMGEALTGDIGTVVKQFGRREEEDGLPNGHSRTDSLEQLESRAFGMLVERQVASEELTALHKEYDELASREAGIVKVADRLDAWIHALNTPSVQPLIQAWCYYNKETYKKLRANECCQKDKAFWIALAEMFRGACRALIDKTVIIVNRSEKIFNDPKDWPAKLPNKRRTKPSSQRRGQRG